MPTIFREYGFRFFFYSNEGFEPMHIHVSSQNCEAKFWMPDCELVWNYRFNAAQLRKIFEILQENKEMITEVWDEYFG
ncbi:hypothetical protein COY51_00395 [Candidatus Desantisbacteria bacterium CG_4_10_14_0_8_um_filter_39_17]|uniref:DUF4160 domain-containing protein n=1 Tax=Candidatus Desantisbacteria bacterium CG_4_10_14_0_8_um_filter_39_17 TaxID=1974542 RepID=A0A2H9PD78_9BACT|nr:MAG: hypothetical protein COY51_00395 [Candidatus Desantisbacteria bacterium CG_4_10_14_0_8_um_filter_39_17]